MFDSQGLKINLKLGPVGTIKIRITGASAGLRYFSGLTNYTYTIIYFYVGRA